MSFFSAENISAGYQGRNVVHQISFTVEKGELVGILGGNGSGKTTLLKAVCGILRHDGSCVLNGQKLEKLSAKALAGYVSYIPQRSGISIDISALDVVLMGFNPQLGLLERPNNAMLAAAMQALERVGLPGKEHTNYLCLSEGQKQLCILARTLVSGSRLLLLDEPESALDFRFRHEMLFLIRSWLSEADRCGIVTLHDPILALNHCDRLLLLSQGELMGIIRPKSDPLDNMEKLLENIYGKVALLRCKNHSGLEQLVMLKEGSS